MLATDLGSRSTTGGSLPQVVAFVICLTSLPDLPDYGKPAIGQTAVGMRVGRVVRANLIAIGISPARFADRCAGILLSDATELLVATSPKADCPSSSAPFGSRAGSG